MMTKVKIVTHPAHLGAVSGEDLIDTSMRLIGTAFGDSDEWPEKYGTTIENDVFLMHQFCWCEKDDGSCLWCMHGDHPQFDALLRAKFPGAAYDEHAARHYYDPPNFWYKPSDFRLAWYKYIGRDMASNTDSLPGDFLHRIFATHPTGMTLEQAIDQLAERTENTRRSFELMLERLGVKAGPSAHAARGAG